MSQSLPILVAASLFAGGVGAVATTVLVDPASGPKGGTSVQGPNDEVLAAIDDLRAETMHLAERIVDLETAENLAPVGASGSPRTSVATPSDIEQMIKDVFASMSPSDAGVAPTPAMQQVVENVIELREERERLEREQRRAEAEAQRLEDRLASLQTDLGLDPNQVDGMRQVFQDERARQDEMRDNMRTMRESGDMGMDQMRDMWTGMRDATNQAIQGVLTAGQYEQYQESQQNQRGGGRGGFGGRGGGDGGGGGRRGN